jgi:hypothetical protein
MELTVYSVELYVNLSGISTLPVYFVPEGFLVTSAVLPLILYHIPLNTIGAALAKIGIRIETIVTNTFFI